ncbi:hypothetical protein, partial [Tenacibaculum discolor]|uniref:hypothetical protein n=1 Tax=Tenacibaculum discolor TaxID=361581 RepID=UPI00159BD91D
NWQIANGVSTGTTRTTDILGSIDFASRTISYSITTLYYDGSSWQYGSANGSSTFTIGNHLANPSGAYPIQFAVSATGSASLGSYISGSVTVSYQTILNLLPTNSGNTV